MTSRDCNYQLARAYFAAVTHGDLMSC